MNNIINNKVMRVVKKVIPFYFFTFLPVPTMAQDQCELPLMIVVPEQTVELSPMAESQLTGKIRQVVTQNGMGGGARYSNFSIVANLVETSKQITSGLRPLVTITTGLELYVANNRTGDKFASTAVTLSGAGKNERTAYQAAISSLRPDNTSLQSFMKTAKRKIIAYYDTQTKSIIRQAKSLSAQQDFEQALFLLTSIPTCINQYDAVEEAILTTMQTFVDQDCTAKINKARQVWNATQNREGAKLAGAYLAAINPQAQCSDEAMELADEIHQRIGEEWEWAKDMKEFSKEMARSQVDLEKMRIEAARAIGVAFGENQQPEVLTIHQNNQHTIEKVKNNKEEVINDINKNNDEQTDE